MVKEIVTQSRILFVLVTILFVWLLIELIQHIRKNDIDFQNLILIQSKLLNYLIFLTIVFSILRIIFLDGPISVDDGYNLYAKFLTEVWQSKSEYRTISIITIIQRHQLRFVFPYLVAILSYILPNVIISGIIISTLASLTGLFYLELLLDQFDLSINTKKTVLALTISHVTIIVNFSRFATNQVYVAFCLISLYYITRLVQNGSFRDLRLAFVTSFLAFLTREIGIFLLLTFFVWMFFLIANHFTSISPGNYFLVLVNIAILFLMLGLYLARYIPLVYNLMYELLLAASTNSTALSLLSGNYTTFISLITGKFGIKLFETGFYLISQLVVFIGLFFTSPTLDNEYELELLKYPRLYPVLSYLSLFIISYILFKQGRSLDRFFLSIIPLVILLNVIVLHNRFNRELNSNSIPIYLTISFGYVIFLLRTGLSIVGFSI